MAQAQKNLKEQLRSDLGGAEETSPTRSARTTTPLPPPSSPFDPHAIRQVLSFSNGHTTKSPQKTILISGGTAGIGLALVHLFAEKGFNVATFSSTEEKVRPTQEAFKEYPNVWVEQIDVRDTEKLSWFVQVVEQRFKSPIQFLINNAAITGPFLPNEEVFSRDSQMTFDVNFHGLMSLTTIAQNSMRIAHINNSVIINLSSLTAKGIAGAGSYSASKAAVNTFSASLAKEHPFSSHFVFAFDPGPVDTAMQDKIRDANPKKFRFAETAKKLHSDGKLAKPHETAEQIYFMITHPELFLAQNGAVISHTAVQEQIDHPLKRKRSPSFP